MLVTSLRRLRRRRAQLSLGGIKSGCCCAATKICITLCSNSIALVGATVTVTGLGSCVTGADGCCDAPWLTSGSHSYTVVDSEGDTVTSAGHTWTAGVTNTVNIGFPTTGDCCSIYYVPATLSATDAQGSFLMKYAGTDFSGNPTWTGGHSPSVNSCTVTTPGGTCLVAAPTTGPVPVCYTLTCTSSGTPVFTLLRAWGWVNYTGSPGAGQYPYQHTVGDPAGSVCGVSPPSVCGSPNTDTASGTITSGPSNAPFAISFSMADAAGNATADPAAGGVTITQ